MISIVIPCYNGEKYILDNFYCFENQIDKDFEIIYVNDGSSDDTEKLLNFLAEKYQFVSTVSISNCGVMHARRIGLNYAKYDYVTFVDIDDIIEVDFIQKFKKNIKLEEIDIVGSNFKILNNDKKLFLNKFLPGIYTNENFLEILCTNSGWELCGKVYKKKLFENVKYPEKIAIGEDALVFFQLVVFSSKIKIIDEYLYTYVQYSISASHIKSLDKCRDGLQSAIYIRNFLQMNTNLQKKYLDSLILLFYSNSLRRGFLKRSDIIFFQIKQSMNFNALSILPYKKRIIVILGFFLMGINF